MTIYNSQRVNSDPLPYQLPCGSRDRSPLQYEFKEGRIWGKRNFGAVYNPRPKYDNNVNRALEFFRLDATYPAIAKGYSLRDRAKIFITFWDDPEFYFNEREFTAEERYHAHRVLTKLINVYKETA